MNPMFRANLIEPQKIVIEEVPGPQLKEGETLVKVDTCGICGSDVHAYFGRHPFIRCPIVLGHEFTGIVEETTAEKEVKIGQKVTAVPMLTCGNCINCRKGRYNICRNLRFIGSQASGAFAEYVVVPTDKTVRIPDEIDLGAGALIEPLAVGVHAVKRSNLKSGDRVLILGAGPIGLMALQAAKALGADEVIVSDLIDYRLQKAKELGADYTVRGDGGKIATFTKDKFGDDGIDLIFECVGAESTIQQAVEMASKGTQVVVVGVFEKETPIKMGWVQDHELELIGSMAYVKEDFSEAIRLVQEKKVITEALVTHKFKFKEINTAFEIIGQEEEKRLKVLIEI